MPDHAYLDNAATTFPKPEAVYRAMDDFARRVGGNPGRSGHRRALEAGRELVRCRQALARLLGAAEPGRIILTRNATEALNLAVRGFLKPGAHAVISSLEHNSLLRPVHALSRKAGVSYDVVDCSAEGAVDLEAVRGALRPATTLLAFSHASNVLGAVLPVRELAEIAHRHGAALLVDAAQTAGRLPLDVASDALDLVAFSGHKELLGPQGTGGLYVAPGIELEPLLYGGTGSDSTSPEQPSFLPDRFEPGTANALGAAGLRAGVEFILERGVDSVRDHEGMLTARLLEGLDGLPGAVVYGPRDWSRRVGVVSFNLEGISSAEVAAFLNERHDIAVRAGLHCAPLAHRTLGTLDTGTVRVGFSLLNHPGQVDRLLSALKEL